MKYTIWIIPPDPLYTKLRKIIETKARENDSPSFEPHITLLGGIEKDLDEITRGTTELAKNITKLSLTLGPVSFSTTYFQSVFVRVNSTAKLLQLNLDAKKLFNYENNIFMPHISLLYGNHDMGTRERIASEIHLLPANFTVQEFVITPDTLNPDVWRHLTTIPFGS